MSTSRADDVPESMRIDIDPLSYVADMAPDLKLVLGYVIVTLAFIYLPVIDGTFIRSALGLAMVLFVPGYALTSALFPGKKDIDGIMRTALSFALSWAVSPLIGLVLNYTPWGIRLDPIVACLSVFTVACVLAANKRRNELAEGDRFSIDVTGYAGRLAKDAFAGDKTAFDRSLTVVLILSALLLCVVLAGVLLFPQNGEKLTEFYILGPDGTAENYPTTYALGEQKPVIVGVANHEDRGVTYDLVVTLNNSTTASNLYSGRMTLGDNQTWEKAISLRPDLEGTNMSMRFLLYKDGNMTAPYHEIHLWANVTAQP